MASAGGRSASGGINAAPTMVKRCFELFKTVSVHGNPASPAIFSEL